MRRTRFAAVLLAAAYATGAAAPPKPEVGRYMDVSSTVLPIVWQGRLVNYVFVKLRLMMAPGVDAANYRDKEPYFRDALVRIGHHTPFVDPGDFTRVDESALRRVLLAEASRIVGPRVVSGVVVVSQSPQRVSGLPRSPRTRTPPG